MARSELNVEEQTQSESLPAGDEPQPDAVLDAAEVGEEEEVEVGTCVVCQQAMFRKTPCGHVFHTACVHQTWDRWTP